VIKRLNRVDEDASGLTFEEWDPTENVDSVQMPVTMMINSSELRAAGFTLQEVFPLELEAVARRRSTRGTGIRQLEGMGPKRFILSADNIKRLGPMQWMMTLSLGHDVSECVFVYFGLVSSKKKVLKF